MLSSPTGTGKTYIAADLAYNAICKRNKAFFRNMSDILSTLRWKELAANASKEFKRLSEARLPISVNSSSSMNQVIGWKEQANYFLKKKR